MSKSEKDLETFKQALDYDWPEIQKSLIGDGVGVDSWWLDRFDRKDVILQLPGVVIMNTKPWHAEDVAYVCRAAYGIREREVCDDCFDEQEIKSHIARFAEGQFAAQRISGPYAGHCVGMAVTMRTSRPPTERILPWMEAIGDLQLGAHEPGGEWLYGVEMAVHSTYQGHGIGTGLYEARFQLVRRLNLRGWYAVGMLMGYKIIREDSLRETERFELFNMRGGKSYKDLAIEGRQREVDSQLTDFPRYSDDMTVMEYGEKVIAGEIKDPTVSMQINRGFRAERVVTDYVDEPAAADTGVLIVWENPEYESD